MKTVAEKIEELREKEVGRELKVHSPSRDVYLDQVTLEVELMLKNFEKLAGPTDH